jgi:hypothetical protein
MMRRTRKKLTKKQRKQQKGKSPKPKLTSTKALKKIAAEKTFQLALMIMAQERGFEVETEIPSAEAIIQGWLYNEANDATTLYWANANPLDFQLLLGAARTFYRHFRSHQLLRDIVNKEVLMSRAGEYECVVQQWGIGHMGFYQREMPGINIHRHGEARFAEQLLSDGITVESLTDFHMAQILKDMIYRVISGYSSLSFDESTELVRKLPDDLDSLKSFLTISNGELRSLRDPQRVVANIIKSFGFL